MRHFISFITLIGALIILPCAAQVEPEDEKQSRPSQQNTERAVAKGVDQLGEPLYSPFIERYMLDEIKQLRIDLATARVELQKQIVDRDLNIGDKAMSYAANTVTYFFYLIAAVSSILVIVGWTSIRDIKEKVHSVADREVQKIISTYEQRLQSIEMQVTRKTESIDENRVLIERTQESHALWLRAAQEHTAQGKIHIYDEILKVRPTDSEALAYKADAVLELGEPQWAKNLCILALELDPNYSHAYYQRACANTALNNFDEAIADLARAVNLSEAMVDDAETDEALAPLRDYEPFKELIASRRGV